MQEVIMRMDGSGEDSHGLERVGELVRCEDFAHGSRIMIASILLG